MKIYFKRGPCYSKEQEPEKKISDKTVKAS